LLLHKLDYYLSEVQLSYESDLASSKSKRLTRVYKGNYSPPYKRICILYYHWTSRLLSELGESVSVCQKSWWTKRNIVEILFSGCWKNYKNKKEKTSFKCLTVVRPSSGCHRYVLRTSNRISKFDGRKTFTYTFN